MPILSYFAVVGSVLVALLLVADATMEKSGPLPFNNESVGLPKPWHPESGPRSDAKTAILTPTPAPAPDMTSELVRAAAPPAAQIAPAAEAHAARAQAVPEQTAKLDPAPKKKRMVRKPRHDDGWQSYAWSARNGNDGFFGGGNSTFGRF